MQLTAQVHQPKMKVFTVGLDEKVKMDTEKGVVESEISEKATPLPSSTPPPLILQARAGSRSPYRGAFACLALLIFMLLLALTLSEIAYNRQRDEAFFRLKWAEMKQRMLGYDLLRAQAFNQMGEAKPVPSASLKQEIEGVPPVVDERLAFSNRLNSEDRENDNELATPSNKNDRTSPGETPQVDLRFAFLRAILEKLRERAQAVGLDGRVDVSLIEVRRPDAESRLNPSSSSFQDGFGEIHAPRPFFGPLPQEHEDFQQNAIAPSDFFGPNWDEPSSQFRTWDRFPRPMRPVFFPRTWHSENGDSSREEAQNDSPSLRITHHYEADRPHPNRVVTELFGDQAAQALQGMLAAQQQMLPVMPEAQPLNGLNSEGSSWPRWAADNSPPPESQQPAWILPVMSPSSASLPFPPNFHSEAAPPPEAFYPPSPGQVIQPAVFFQQQPQGMDESPVWQSHFGRQVGQNLGQSMAGQSMVGQFTAGQSMAGQSIAGQSMAGQQQLPSTLDSAQERTESAQPEPLHQVPWYVPRGFENQRPSWAAGEMQNNQADTAQDQQQRIPLILPHPSAMETPLVLEKEKQNEWRVNAWQHTQPEPSLPSDALAPVAESSRSLLPERDNFDSEVPPPLQDATADKLTAAVVQDDSSLSHPLFQIDDPHSMP